MLNRQAIINSVEMLERNARPEQRVLVVTDSGMDQDVPAILTAAAEEAGLVHAVLQIPPPPAPNADPDPDTASRLLGYDLVLLATSVPITHTPSMVRAAEAGARIVLMDGVNSAMLAEGAAGADYERMHQLGLAIERRWNKARHVTVLADNGTQFEANVTGRQSWRLDGTIFEADWFALPSCAFPDGEVGIAPLEGSGNGTVVWDSSVHSFGIVEEPIRLTVVDGFVTQIDGGGEAQQLARRLEELNDPNAYYCPAEIAIGINERARIIGTLREDKKKLGTVHIAIGTNKDIGGTISAAVHIDGLLDRPTVVMDGQTVVAEGQIRV